MISIEERKHFAHRKKSFSLSGCGDARADCARLLKVS